MSKLVKASQNIKLGQKRETRTNLAWKQYRKLQEVN